ncbi:AAA-domain-containing protein [Rhizopogon vinicolor AM-OR11-026]|uniref:AAA-domain-containing protein n=1 Tax=Rhizopogon vinicolor AM-OR11-026 TaxID=1314800 RepID=A0A1B7NFE5_9AGAM|nr:AAA-domain-containing protein [Rhizopogon vinicolor AM-OR11-026]
MRSSTLIRRSRSLLKASTTRTSIVHNPAIRLARVARKDGTPPTRVYKRLASSTLTPDASDSTPDPSYTGSVPPPAASSPPEEPEKPTKRTRVSTSSTASPSSQPEEGSHLPDDLNVLWVSDGQAETDFVNNDALPPPELFEEALTNLHIALHPQTQHRAAYASSSGPPLEPTLALYCPIEGGDYVIDATVKELARRTGSEVLVIDAVQLAAGECGHFGKAASALQLPRNPLHFHPPLPPTARIPSRSVILDEDNDIDMDMMPMAIPSQMTLHLLASPSTRGRTSILAAPRSSPTPNRIKTFFDDLVNMPSPNDNNNGASNNTRPRIIYVRDFPTLASTSATWYPHLLSAVRQRRIGAISRPSSPVSSPMTIVFGVTPPIAPTTSVPSATPAGPSQHGLVNFTARRRSPNSAVATPHRSTVADWGEDDIAERAREKRLKERLRRWEKSGDSALLDDLPTLFARSDESEGENGHRGVVIVGGSGGSPVPPMLESLIAQRMMNSSGVSEGELATPFFRASVLVPGARLQVEERLCRTGRRREINELAMRMGVGAVGGILERAEAVQVQREGVSQEGSQEDIWDDWSNRLEAWVSVRQIADRALGSVVSSPGLPQQKKLGLEPTPVPWDAVHRAWAAQRSSRDWRKTLMRESGVKIVKQKDPEEDHDDAEGEEEESGEKVDEVVERVRQDPELEQHEQRLLSCIVDTASLSTTFNQVHLPEHTIDAVRTIVSLPLLHPAAFQQGILKEHGMTGCLLFGPPGTGKTLVVRALAKEAGCRMMMISPSDVMDMYVGEGEKLVKAVFSLARRLSPCVVFLDEMDALFGARMSGRESGGAFAHRGVITEFMQEMDGLKSSREDRVIVIGATNRPFDLDDAVLRRVPRRLLVDLPGEKEREGKFEILKILLRDETLAHEIDLKALAKKTESFSGSDLKHLCVSAALDAVKENVEVPWKPDLRTSPSANDLVTPPEVASLDTASVSQTSATETTQADAQEPSLGESVIEPPPHVRVIHLRHFTQALKEITPSSSESLGSLADLRKWNEEFGEGRKDKKRHQVWGKGRFGFIDKAFPIQEDGRVTNRAPQPSQSSIEQ